MENLVTALYQRLMLREPTEAEITSGLSVISGGGESALEAQLAATPEAVEVQTVILPIIGLYQGILVRTPEPSGLSFWTDAIQSGSQTFTDLIRSFAETSEVQARFPELGDDVSNEELVNLFYQNILGRVPDAEGFTFWLNALSNGTATISDFVSDFIGSDEAQALIGANIVAYYADLTDDGIIESAGNADSLLPEDQGDGDAVVDGGGAGAGGGTPTNTAPVADDDDLGAVETGETVTFQASALLENDTDADGNALSIASVSSGRGGSVAYDAADGTVTFSPESGYTGPADFTYTVSDGNGGTSQAATVNFVLQDADAKIVFGNEETWGSVTEELFGTASGTTGTTVGTLNVVSGDGAYSYSITGGNEEETSLFNNIFEISDGTLKLKDGVHLDYETRDTYVLTVTAAYDQDEVTQDLTVNVTEIDLTPSDSSMEFAVKVTGTFDEISESLNYQRLFDFWNWQNDSEGYNDIWLGQVGSTNDIAFEIFNDDLEKPLPRVVLEDAIVSGQSQTWIGGFHITDEDANVGTIYLFQDVDNDGKYTEGEASVIGEFDFSFEPGARENEYVARSGFEGDSPLEGVVSDLEILNPGDINLVGLFSQDESSIEAV